MSPALRRAGCGAWLCLYALAAGADAPTASPGPIPSTQQVSPAAREDLPLWEVGLAVAAAGSPDYPGADRTRARALPLPYGIYRGRVFGGDADAASPHRVRPTAELDISFGGALPADSSGNGARQGMPDLDLLLEVGPQLSILLAHPGRASYLNLALPARLVLSANLDGLRPRGLVFAPELSYNDGKFLGRGWNTRLSLGSTFATAPLMGYFYGVAPQYATDDRPAYKARAGYLQTNLTAAVSRAFVARTTLFGFLRLSSQEGATNTDSPLLRQRVNYAFGIGVAYTFLQSERTVVDTEE